MHSVLSILALRFLAYSMSWIEAPVRFMDYVRHGEDFSQWKPMGMVATFEF